MDMNKLVTRLKALPLKDLERICAKNNISYSTALKVRNGYSRNPRWNTTSALWKAVL